MDIRGSLAAKKSDSVFHIVDDNLDDLDDDPGVSYNTFARSSLFNQERLPDLPDGQSPVELPMFVSSEIAVPTDSFPVKRRNSLPLSGELSQLDNSQDFSTTNLWKELPHLRDELTRLETAQQKLKQANEEKLEKLKNLSHENKNLINQLSVADGEKLAANQRTSMLEREVEQLKSEIASMSSTHSSDEINAPIRAHPITSIAASGQASPPRVLISTKQNAGDIFNKSMTSTPVNNKSDINNGHNQNLTLSHHFDRPGSALLDEGFDNNPSVTDLAHRLEMCMNERDTLMHDLDHMSRMMEAMMEENTDREGREEEERRKWDDERHQIESRNLSLVERIAEMEDEILKLSKKVKTQEESEGGNVESNLDSVIKLNCETTVEFETLRAEQEASKAEIEALKSINFELQTTVRDQIVAIDSLSAKLSIADDNLVDANKSISDLSSQLESKTSEVLKISEENAKLVETRLSEERNLFQNKITQLNDRETELLANTAALQEEQFEMQNKIQTLIDQLATHSTDLFESHDRIKHLEEEVSISNENRHSLESEIKILNESLADATHLASSSEKLHGMEKDLEYVAKSLNECEKELAETKERLNLRETHIIHVEDELKAKDIQLSELETKNQLQLKQMELEIEELHVEKDVLVQQIKTFEMNEAKKDEEFKASVLQLQDLLDESRNTESTKQSMIDSLEQSLDEVRSQLSSKSLDLDDLMLQHDNMRLEYNNRIDALESELESISSHAANSVPSAVRDELTSEILSLKSTISTLNSRLDEVEGELDSKNNEFDDLSRQSDLKKEELELKIEEINAIIVDKSAQATHLEMTLKEAEKRVHDLDAKLALKEEAVGIEKGLNFDLQKSLDELKAQLEVVQEKCLDANEEKNRIGLLLLEKENEILDLDKSLKNMENLMNQKEKVIYDLNVMSEAYINSHAKEVDDLNNQLLESINKISEKEQELIKVLEEKSSLHAENELLHEAVLQLTDELKSLTGKLQESQDELALAQQNFNKAESEISQLNDQLTHKEHLTTTNAESLKAFKAQAALVEEFKSEMNFLEMRIKDLSDENENLMAEMQSLHEKHENELTALALNLKKNDHAIEGSSNSQERNSNTTHTAHQVSSEMDPSTLKEVDGQQLISLASIQAQGDKMNSESEEELEAAMMMRPQSGIRSNNSSGNLLNGYNERSLIAELKEKVEDLELSKLELEEQVESAESQLRLTNAKVNSLRATLADLQDDNTRIFSDLDSTRAELNEALRTVYDLELEKEEMLENISLLNKQKEELFEKSNQNINSPTKNINNNGVTSIFSVGTNPECNQCTVLQSDLETCIRRLDAAEEEILSLRKKIQLESSNLKKKSNENKLIQKKDKMSFDEDENDDGLNWMRKMQFGDSSDSEQEQNSITHSSSALYKSNSQSNNVKGESSDYKDKQTLTDTFGENRYVTQPPPCISALDSVELSELKDQFEALRAAHQELVDSDLDNRILLQNANNRIEELQVQLSETDKTNQNDDIHSLIAELNNMRTEKVRLESQLSETQQREKGMIPTEPMTWTGIACGGKADCLGCHTMSKELQVLMSQLDAAENEVLVLKEKQKNNQKIIENKTSTNKIEEYTEDDNNDDGFNWMRKMQLGSSSASFVNELSDEETDKDQVKYVKNIEKASISEHNIVNCENELNQQCQSCNQLKAALQLAEEALASFNTTNNDQNGDKNRVLNSASSSSESQDKSSIIKNEPFNENQNLSNTSHQTVHNVDKCVDDTLPSTSSDNVTSQNTSHNIEATLSLQLIKEAEKVSVMESDLEFLRAQVISSEKKHKEEISKLTVILDEAIKEASILRSDREELNKQLEGLLEVHDEQLNSVAFWKHDSETKKEASQKLESEVKSLKRGIQELELRLQRRDDRLANVEHQRSSLEQELEHLEKDTEKLSQVAIAYERALSEDRILPDGQAASALLQALEESKNEREIHLQKIKTSEDLLNAGCEGCAERSADLETERLRLESLQMSYNDLKAKLLSVESDLALEIQKSSNKQNNSNMSILKNNKPNTIKGSSTSPETMLQRESSAEQRAAMYAKMVESLLGPLERLANRLSDRSSTTLTEDGGLNLRKSRELEDVLDCAHAVSKSLANSPKYFDEGNFNDSNLSSQQNYNRNAYLSERNDTKFAPSLNYGRDSPNIGRIQSNIGITSVPPSSQLNNDKYNFGSRSASAIHGSSQLHQSNERQAQLKSPNAVRNWTNFNNYHSNTHNNTKNHTNDMPKHNNNNNGFFIQTPQPRFEMPSMAELVPPRRDGETGGVASIVVDIVHSKKNFTDADENHQSIDDNTQQNHDTAINYFTSTKNSFVNNFEKQDFTTSASNTFIDSVSENNHNSSNSRFQSTPHSHHNNNNNHTNKNKNTPQLQNTPHTTTEASHMSINRILSRRSPLKPSPMTDLSYRQALLDATFNDVRTCRAIARRAKAELRTGSIGGLDADREQFEEPPPYNNQNINNNDNNDANVAASSMHLGRGTSPAAFYSPLPRKYNGSNNILGNHGGSNVNQTKNINNVHMQISGNAGFFRQI